MNTPIVIGSLIATAALVYYALFWIIAIGVDRRMRGCASWLLSTEQHTVYGPALAIFWFICVGVRA